jgi:hypothetical protein
MSIYIAALDLGQVNDYAALVITEAKGTLQKVFVDEIHPEVNLPYTAQKFVHTMPLSQFDVRHIERFPLGTKYATVAAEMEKRIKAMPGPRYFVLDKTGVGLGAIELFDRLSPIGITFTGGDEERAAQDGEQLAYYVPKRNLISAAQLLLQTRVMRIAKGQPFADILMKELQNFKMKISLAGHDTYEAWRERDHDDLVNALAMACWMSRTIISVSALEVLGKRRREDPPIISQY